MSIPKGYLIRLIWLLIVSICIPLKTLWGQHHLIRPHDAGNYTSLFYIRDVSDGPLHNHPGFDTFSQNTDGMFFTVMYPGKTMGAGISIAYLNRAITLRNAAGKLENHSLTGWGDLSLVAKYRFGIYKKFSFQGKKRLLKAVVCLISSLKLPTATATGYDSGGKRFSPPLSLGNKATEFSFGFAFHTDTQKYFRIHGHLSATFPLKYAQFNPGKSLHYNLTYIPVHLGIKNFLYPEIGIKGIWHGKHAMNGVEVSDSGGNQLMLALGMSSVWLYLGNSRIFTMLEITAMLPIHDTFHYGQALSSGILGGIRFFRR